MRASRKGGLAISPFLSLRGFPKESRGNLFFNGMYHNSSSKNEIATPERFSVQARNDKKVSVALLLAMTTRRTCHCEAFRREAVAISILDCFVVSLLAETMQWMGN